MSDYSGANLSSLKRRLTALFAITAAAVIAGGVAYNNSYRASLVKDAEKLLLSIEEFKIQQLIYWRNDRMNDTMSLLDSPILSKYLDSLAADPSNAVDKALLTKRLQAYLRNNRYTEALITGIDCKVIVSAGKKLERACPEAGEILGKANVSGRPEMGDFYVLPGENRPHLDLVTRAAKGPAGKNLFLLLRIDPQDYIYPLIEKWPTNSRTGETLLAAREEDRIVYISELRHLRGAAMKLQLPAVTPDLPAARAFTGKAGIVRGRDYRGVEVLAAVNTIPGTNWAIVTKLDMDEVLAGSGRVSLLLMLLALSLLGTAGAGAYLVFRRQAEEYRRSYAELDRQASALKDNYARLTAQANDAIIIADAQTLRIIETNKKSREVYGYTEEEFQRLKLSDLVPESGLARQRERVEAVRSGTGAVIEAEHKRKNGELFPAEISSSCTSGSGREFIFAIVRDLSERMRMEQALRDSEENYRQLFEAESDAILLIDNENGELKQANNAAAVLYGYTHEELLAMRNTDLSAEPEDTSRVTRTTPLDAGKVVVIPLRYHRKKSGEVFPVEITGRFFTRNGRPVHLVAIRDITERKRAEEKLRLGEERLRMAAEAAQFGVYAYDIETGLRSYSPEFLGLFGLPPGSELPLDAEHAPQAIYPEDREGFIAARRGGYDPLGTGLVEHEFRVILPTGQLRWLKVKGRTVFTGTGPGARPLRANGIIQDVTEIKQAELTLRESEERYRSLFENMLNGFAYCRMVFEHGKPADFVYLSVNKAFETLTGLKGVAGKKVSEVIPGIRETDPGLLETYGRVALGGQPETFETYLKALKMWFAVSVYSPEKEHFVAVFDVITERKQAEEALKQSNALMDATQHLAGIGGWEWDLAARTMHWTRETYLIHGFDPSELEPSPEAHIARSQSCYSPEDRPVLMAAFDRCVENGEPYDLELPFTSTKGRRLWVRSTGRAERQGGKIVKVLGTLSDITAAKLAKHALEESERALREAQEMAHLGYWNWDVKTGAVEWSEEVFRIFRLDPEKFTPQIDSIMELSPWPEENERDKELIRRATQTREKGTYTQRFLRPDKSVGYYHSTFQGKYDDQGGLTSIVGTILDVTERKLAELALEKLNRDLVEKKQEMENFLYITTHDLRGPLVNIQGFSQNLEHYLLELKENLGAAGLPPGPKQALEKLTGDRIPTALKFILESSRKMDALITALLKVSRLGRVEMKPETVEMNGLVDKVAESLRYQLEQAGGEVKHGDLPRCKADPGAVSQLFANLLDNAIKYRQEGRPLAISVDGEIKDGMAFYRVSDNGCGIPGADLGRIWDIFYRRGSAGGKRGEGIGLPMVKRLAEKNGGSITAESRPGEGSVFRVTLPAA